MSWEVGVWFHFFTYAPLYFLGIIVALIYLIIQVSRLTKHVKADIAKKATSSPEGAKSVQRERTRTKELIYEGLGWFAIIIIIISLIYFN